MNDYITCIMSDIKFKLASQHAITLVLDIIHSSAFLFDPILDEKQLENYNSSEDKISELLKTSSCFIGFDDNLPFGCFFMHKQDDCCQLQGPFLYSEYLGKRYGDYLINQAVLWAHNEKLNLIYLFSHPEAIWANNFFGRHDFENISDNQEFIKRWHDGIVADVFFDKPVILYARLLENTE